MTTINGTVEQAIAAGASRALLKRAAALRVSAGSQKTWIKDQKGRDVEIGTPEATIMLETAALFEECAAEVARAPL